jgi:hypothetical protein
MNITGIAFIIIAIVLFVKNFKSFFLDDSSGGGDKPISPFRRFLYFILAIPAFVLGLLLVTGVTAFQLAPYYHYVVPTPTLDPSFFHYFATPTPVPFFHFSTPTP